MTLDKKLRGRPIAEPTYPVMLRLTAPCKEKYLELGGAKWVKRLIGKAIEPETDINKLVSVTLARARKAEQCVGETWHVQISEWALMQAIGNRTGITIEEAAHDWLIETITKGLFEDREGAIALMKTHAI